MRSIVGLESKAVDEVRNRLIYAIWVKYDQICNDRYDKKEKTRLERIKSLYQQHVATKIPYGWELDEEDRPRYHLSPYNFFEFVQAQLYRQGGLRVFHHYSSSIGYISAAYLQARKSRVFANGKSNDVLNLIFGELLDFAVNVLGSLTPEEVVDQLKSRIAYVDAIMRDPLIFPAASVSRSHNKRDKMELIRREFHQCLAYAEQEKIRSSARDTCMQLRAHLQSTVLGGIQCLYQARGQLVNEFPLTVHSYLFGIQLGRDVATKDDQMYASIREKTVTGRWLFQLLQSVPGIAFASLDIERSLSLTVEHDQPLGDIQINAEWIKQFKEQLDLPEWVKEAEQQAVIAFFTHLFAIARGVYRLGYFVFLVDRAGQLAGDEGNRWAYGDENGRDALAVLLLLLQKELAQFKALIHEFNDNAQHQIRLYVHSHKKEYTEGAIPNFTSLNEEVIAAKKSIESALTNIGQLKQGIDQFPNGKAEEIEHQKRDFFRYLVLVCQKFYSDENEYQKKLLAIYEREINRQKTHLPLAFSAEPSGHVNNQVTLSHAPAQALSPSTIAKINAELRPFDATWTYDQMNNQFALSVSDDLMVMDSQREVLKKQMVKREVLLRWFKRSTEPSLFSSVDSSLSNSTRGLVQSALKQQQSVEQAFLNTLSAHLSMDESLGLEIPQPEFGSNLC